AICNGFHRRSRIAANEGLVVLNRLHDVVLVDWDFARIYGRNISRQIISESLKVVTVEEDRQVNVTPRFVDLCSLPDRFWPRCRVLENPMVLDSLVAFFGREFHLGSEINLEPRVLPKNGDNRLTLLGLQLPPCDFCDYFVTQRIPGMHWGSE